MTAVVASSVVPRGGKTSNQHHSVMTRFLLDRVW
jgi:hypothetical protein